jgi:hypothetical protein
MRPQPVTLGEAPDQGLRTLFGVLQCDRTEQRELLMLSEGEQ